MPRHGVCACFVPTVVVMVRRQPQGVYANRLLGARSFDGEPAFRFEPRGDVCIACPPRIDSLPNVLQRFDSRPHNLRGTTLHAWTRSGTHAASQPDGPITAVAVAGVLLVVTVLAAFVPTRRAASIDPVTALRAEA